MSVAGGTVEAMTPQALIRFESRWPQHTPAKVSAVRRELGLTPARYYQLLDRAAHTVEGITADPITARKVREQATRSDRYARGLSRRRCLS